MGAVPLLLFFCSAVHGLPVEENGKETVGNGFLSALPYIVLWVTQMTAGLIADSLRRRGFFSTTSTRKLMNTVGLLCPACLLVATGYTGCDHMLAVLLLTIGVGGGGFAMAGYTVNHLDIAPEFAGTLMGITNGIATIPGFLGPAVVGVLTQNNQTVGQWRLFFYITAGLYLTGVIAFILLAKGEEQSWAQLPGVPSLTSALNQECEVAAPVSRKTSVEDPRDHRTMLTTAETSIQNCEDGEGRGYTVLSPNLDDAVYKLL